MPMRLGLDLGPNSLGWALIDTDSTCVTATGVRVFPEGVDRDTKGGELSKNEARRVARGMRRQITRRAKRKHRLRKLLADTGLLPAPAALPRSAPQRQEWETHAFKEHDIYALRRAALNGKLELYEIGRIILHLCQRRGFLSNSKADKARKKEASQMLAEISELEAQIAAASCRTLGEHLAGLTDKDPLARLRGRHTRRDMYQREFDAVWQTQQSHHPGVLTEDRRERIHHIIFYQRPIRIPKSMVGCCELEPKRRRCPIADRRAQRFRMLQDINNLLLIDEHGEERPLTPEERSRLLDYLSASASRKFDDIRKHLGFSEHVRFNLERGERKSLYGMKTDKELSQKDCFGKGWLGMEEEQKNRIVRCLLEEDDDAIKHQAVSEWGLTKEQADNILDADLPAGYMSFSREAIAKLLPHLEQRLPLMTGDDRPCAITLAGYLRPDQKPVERTDHLPQPPDLPNPIVRQALHEVRKVVNAIIRQYGRPDQIHIELAREVRGSAKQRAEYIFNTRKRENRRQQAAEEIRQANFDPNRQAVNRFLLWSEQDRVCAYTGRPISLAQLLGGEVDVDHILPKPRSLDDSMMNKVVCFRSANAEKGDRTPYEWLAGADPQRYEELCRRARKLPYYGKYRKFLLKELKLDDFVHRQLNDTAYISRAVREYLRPLVADPHADILCTKGQLTAELRHGWGLDTILSELPDSPAWREGADLGPGQKDRSDHRHHAIDAVVIALTDRSRLQQLARQRVCPPPRERFRDEIVQLLKGVRVSHRLRRKVAGQLHEETLYGKTHIPGEFAYRKPLDRLTTAEVERIRDRVVREKVIQRLGEFGVRAGRKKKGQSDGESKNPPEAWSKPLWMNEEKKIPIKTVRLTKPDETIQPIRGGAALVKPGSTHHLCIFQLPNGKRDAVFVTMLEAARRAANGLPIIQRTHPQYPDAKFVMSLSGGELILTESEEDQRVIQYNTAASTTGQLWFVSPNDARPSGAKQKDSFSANTLRGKKITIGPLGEVRWAND